MAINIEEKNEKQANLEAKMQAKREEAKSLLKELVEAGVHFGHETSKRNPRMNDYIHSTQNNLHILDITRTVVNMMDAAEYLKRQVKLDRNILFVGTSKQSSEVVVEAANKADVYYINQRWLGGFVTNFETIRTRLNKLRELEHQSDSGGFKGLGKKEIAMLNRQISKLNKSLGGMKKMRGRPEVIIVFDQNKDRLAVTEAKKIGNITLIALCDTDCNPEGVDFPIPANDDSLSSVSFIANYFADAIASAKQHKKK
jgi:small subunit ribosomal protein S2